MKKQRVVVVQDASGGPKTSAIRWALRGLSLKPGDKLTLLALVSFVHNPMGYKNKVDSNSIFGANDIIVEKAVAKTKEEYDKNLELIQLFKLYEMEKVELSIEVASGGTSPKVVAVKEAQNLKATWLILDRKMKKDRKYFLEKLPCGISRMKRYDKIEQLRAPKKQTLTRAAVTYDDMSPGIPEDLFSIEFRPQSDNIEEIKLDQQQQDPNSVCSVCKNIRPGFKLEMDFTYEQLHSATNGFSSTNSLSQAATPSAFHGQLKTNRLKIIIKQHKGEIQNTIKPKLEILTKARHENVLMLLGSCAHENLGLLVYEYACNGSVNQHLSKHCPLPLTWTQRMKIAIGSARGLNYLHDNDILHRNLTSSNILLTHDFEPRLGDFGLPLEQNVDECLEYIAPENAGTRKHSTATDNYAFGVFLLELITARKVTDKMPGGKGLVEWARPLLKDRRHLEIIDPKIAKSHDAEQLYWMSRIILNCLNKVPEKRLAMDKVMFALEYIADKKSISHVMENLSAVEKFLARSSSGIQRNEKKTFDPQSFSSEIDVVSKSFSLTSSATISTSTSFRRSSTSSGMIDKMQGQKIANSGNRNSLSYAEMD